MLVNIKSPAVTIPPQWYDDVLWAVCWLLLRLMFLPQLSWKRREMAFKTEKLWLTDYINGIGSI